MHQNVILQKKYIGTSLASPRSYTSTINVSENMHQTTKIPHLQTTAPHVEHSGTSLLSLRPQTEYALPLFLLYYQPTRVLQSAIMNPITSTWHPGTCSDCPRLPSLALPCTCPSWTSSCNISCTNTSKLQHVRPNVTVGSKWLRTEQHC